MITGLRVAGSPRIVSALGESRISLTDLAANQNEVQVDFVGLSFIPGDVLRYQYKLGDADWSPPTNQRVLNFANLSAGRYRFMVRAVNSDGVLSAEPALITFTVLPLFWLRWWFITVMVLAVISLGFLVYRYHVRRLLEVANMRTRIATDLHDDIGANLTKISILSEVARQQQGNGQATGDNPLASIGRISRESVAAMGDIVWAINPQRDHLMDVVRRMRRHAEELCAAGDIKLAFQAPDEEQDLRLGVNLRRDLFLIFKEALNNATRHSQCKRISVDFRVDASWLTLAITDDGLGFDLSSESDGHGLENMRQRAESLRGEFTIRAAPSAGTKVCLRVLYARSRRLFSEKKPDRPV